MVAGDLDGVLHGLGAGRGKDRLLRKIARQGGIQTFGQFDIIRVRHDLMAGMGETVELRLDGLHDLGVAVAGIHHGDPGGKVDIAIAVLVPDLGVLGSLGIDLRGHPDTLGDGGILAVGHGGHWSLPILSLHFFCKIYQIRDSAIFRRR